MKDLEHSLERTILICAQGSTVFRYFTDAKRFADWWGAGSHIEGHPGGAMRIVYPNDVGGGGAGDGAAAGPARRRELGEPGAAGQGRRPVDRDRVRGAGAGLIPGIRRAADPIGTSTEDSVLDAGQDLIHEFTVAIFDGLKRRPILQQQMRRAKPGIGNRGIGEDVNRVFG